MKKKNKLILGIIVVLVLIGALVFYLFNTKKDDATLTTSDLKWISSNKNKIIDFGIMNDIPLLNKSGEGIAFSLIKNFEDETKLEFNKVSYTYEKLPKEDYAFTVKNEIDKNDLLIYEDNYVLVSTKDNKYNSLSEIDKATVGVLEGNLDEVNKYLNVGNLKYKSFSKYDSMVETLLGEESAEELDYIVLPKLIYLEYFEKYKMYINYNISEITDNYVLQLGDTKKLNNIIKKLYTKWMDDNYEKEYDSEFTNTFYRLYNIDEQQKVKFKSKRYTYGFVEDAPFDNNINNKLVGINSSIIAGFSDVSNVEITFKGLSSVSKLQKEFGENKIDFYFNRYTDPKYDMDTFNTVSAYNENVIILSNIKNNIIVNSLSSLSNKEVLVLDNSLIKEELENNNIKTKSYKTIKDLLRDIKENSIIAIDEQTYNYYKNNQLEEFNIDYTYKLNNNYNYIVRDTSANRVFEKYFDFYLNFINEKNYIDDGYYKSVTATSKSKVISLLIKAVLLLVLFLFGFILGGKFKPESHSKKKKKAIKKSDKLKYIDMLTSLKNRNYLNDSIEKWDDVEVYPQSIVIVDLNNIAYINDNYGHAEGDKVIKEAANILITNQLANTDIIRTNGNEFLIYLVEYDEKQVVAYVKKLLKEFKNLSHSFGAAAGYSMITDSIKTIDDAINEATLDMRNNKQESNN